MHLTDGASLHLTDPMAMEFLALATLVYEPSAITRAHQLGLGNANSVFPSGHCIFWTDFGLDTASAVGSIILSTPSSAFQDEIHTELQ